MTALTSAERFEERASRARALLANDLVGRVDVTMAEAVVIGLLGLGVRDYFVVFGHGSTELGEVLRAYASAGAVRCHPVRHEAEATHAATALRWLRGQRAAVVTSIGPGAMQALAASLAAASNGIGVWHLYGDETTQDEGLNMQQIPTSAQHGFLRLTSAVGASYALHTAEAVGPALRRGADVVEHPYRPGPYFLLLPMNVQGATIEGFNLAELPKAAPPKLGAARPEDVAAAAEVLWSGGKVAVKLGGGARGLGPTVVRLLELVDAVAIASPGAAGVIAASHPRQMGVGGSKGSISGNHAMREAEVLLVVGSRAVCQSDCSRTGYPNVRRVVNVNADVDAVMHYQRTTALLGDGAATLEALVDVLERKSRTSTRPSDPTWLAGCAAAKQSWRSFRDERLEQPCLDDESWNEVVLSQPAAIAVIADAARRRGAVLVFDAGDVQANGFQMLDIEDEREVLSETGSSYMGFAPSALLATAVSDEPFFAVAVCGDGSFTMNPQVLIDGVALGATGCIVVLDNRRMGAISSLQRAQYGADFATSDRVEVDYVRWATAVAGVHAAHGGNTPESLRSALDAAFAHDGVSLVHVPVYYGDDPLGGLGTYGAWNVGPWVEEVQATRHDLAL